MTKTLIRAFRDVDRHKHALEQANLQLKQHLRQYAEQQGLLITPRPESVRHQLGL